MAAGPYTLPEGAGYMVAKPRKARRAAHRAEIEAEAAAAMRPRFSTFTAQRKDVHVIGVERGGLRDFYHWVLTIPWWAFYVCLAGAYLGLNLVFASLYWLDPGGVANTRPHSFIDNFFFSVETISTIGYGVMTPKSLYANLVMTAEAFTGLGMVAIATGLIFSRVSRPTARVLFSRIAVITPFDGVPALTFRAANQRGNQILEAEASVSLFGEVTTLEGHKMRRFQTLQLVRSRQPMFALSWTLMHLIDETSPLFGATADSLEADSAEIVVSISGVDEVFAQRIYARHSYLPDEIVWNRRLADVLSTNENGERVVNYYNFHKLMEPPDEPSH
jgi:inward rectifier potassium channel